MCICNISYTPIVSEAAGKRATTITLNVKSKTLTVGQSCRLKVKKVTPAKAGKSVTYKSSNTKVAKVNSKGKVTARKAGKATITAISKTNKKAKAVCKITVYSKVKTVSISYNTKKLKKGESFALNTVVSPKSASQKVTYKSSNTKIATVTQNGKVTGKKAGKATITVISQTDKSKKAKCVVTVSEADPVSTVPTSTPKPEETPILQPTITSNPSLSSGITRAEWVAALLQAMDCQVSEENLEKDQQGNVLYHFSDIADSTYAKEIETAVIYGYITAENNTQNFNPDSVVTREYAVMTAVNALGVSTEKTIACEDNSDIKYKSEAAYAVEQGMISLEGERFYPNRILTKEEQTTILNRVVQIRQEHSAQISITPVIEYKDSVVAPQQQTEGEYTLSGDSADTYWVKISQESLDAYGILEKELSSGQILVLPATNEIPEGITLKIDTVDKSGDTYTIKGTVPEDISMVYDRIAISGVADADTQTIEPDAGVTVETVNGESQFVISEEAINASLSGGTGELYSKDASFQPNSYVSGKITFKIPDVSYYVDADLSMSEIKVNQVSLTLKENLNVETDLNGSVSGSIPVGETTIPIKEIPGLAIKATVTLEYSASGDVNFVFNIDTQQTIGVKDNALFKEVPSPSVNETLTIEAEGKVGPKLAVALVWPSFKKEPKVIFDASTDFGIGIKGKSVNHIGNGAIPYLHCVDARIYFYLDAALITEDCILYKLCHGDWEIFAESNSPLCEHGHWENGRRVYECTWEEEPTVTVTPLPTKEPTLPPTQVPEITPEGTYAGLAGPRTDTQGKVTYDCVYFGNYPQSDATGETTAPIKWRILSINGADAFLIADQNLDVYRYNEKDTEVTWETSTLRSWLNGYGSDANACEIDYSKDNFINRAFTTTEQEAIPYVTVINEDNPSYSTKGGNNTLDKIYLLSISEASNSAYGFLPYEDESGVGVKDTARERTNTAYVAAGGTIQAPFTAAVGKNNWWWLRSPGKQSTDAVIVTNTGVANRGGMGAGNHKNGALCPVLHLNLSSEQVWSNAGTVTIER